MFPSVRPGYSISTQRRPKKQMPDNTGNIIAFRRHRLTPGNPHDLFCLRDSKAANSLLFRLTLTGIHRLHIALLVTQPES